MGKPLTKREIILQTALTLYANYGYDDVPIREIAFESSIPEDEIKALFPSKRALFDAVVEYVPTLMVHYEPTREDIVELLKTETPEEILNRFVTYYDLDNERLYSCIYRFIFMEQYRSPAIGEMAYSSIIGPPRRNAAKAIGLLAELGAIPPCRGEVIADMWGRTSLMFCMLGAHGDLDMGNEDYRTMTQFFIGMAVRGIDVISVENVDVTWEPSPLDEALALDGGGERERIMRGALELFSREGYTRVTAQRVADYLGIGLVDLYGVFRSREEIMTGLLDAIHHSHSQLAQEPPFRAVLQRGDPQQIILYLTDAYAARRDDVTLQFYRILFREQYFSPHLKDYLASSICLDVESITRELDALAREGRIPPCESKKIATAFVYTMYAYTMDATVLPDGNGQSRQDVIAILSSLVVNGYLR